MNQYTAHIINATIVLLAMSSYCFGPPVPDPPVATPSWGEAAQWTMLGGAALISGWRMRK